MTGDSLPSDAPLRQVPKRHAWTTVMVLCLLYVLSGLDRFVITLFSGPIKSDLNLSDSQLGILYGFAFAFFYAVGALPLGWAVDRFPRRKVAFWCVVFWSASAAACGAAANFVAIFLARAGVGVGEAGLGPASHSMLADSFPRSRLALPMSIYALGGKVGQALSLLIGGALIAVIAPSELFSIPGINLQFHGWQLVFFIVALPGLLCALLVFTFPEPPRHERKAGVAQAGFADYFRFVRRHFSMIGPHHLAQMLTITAVVGVNSWTPAFLERHYGLSPAATGGALGSAMLIAALVGIPLHGFLVDHAQQRGRSDSPLRHLTMVLSAAVPIGVAAFFVENVWATIALVGVFSALVAAYVGIPSTALQMVVPGQLRGKASAVSLLVAAMGGNSLGPFLIGFLTDNVFQAPEKVGYSIAITVAAVLPIAALMFHLARRPMRKLVAEQDAARALA